MVILLSVSGSSQLLCAVPLVPHQTVVVGKTSLSLPSSPRPSAAFLALAVLRSWHDERLIRPSAICRAPTSTSGMAGSERLIRLPSRCNNVLGRRSSLSHLSFPRQCAVYCARQADMPGFGAERVTRSHTISVVISGRAGQTCVSVLSFPRLSEAVCCAPDITGSECLRGSDRSPSHCVRWVKVGICEPPVLPVAVCCAPDTALRHCGMGRSSMTAIEVLDG